MLTRSPRHTIALLIVAFLSACSFVPNHKGYDDLIKIAVENVSPTEEEAFKAHFRSEINDEIELNYVGPPSATRTAKFTLKITVLDTSQDQGGRREPGAKTNNAEIRSQMLNYTYRTRLDLIRNQDKQLVWSWQPDQMMTYSDYKKSIKWLARYSAKTMAKNGLFKDRHFK